MLKVTLISARKNTSLRLICLYDGKIGDPVYNLLKDFKVEIIIHELPYKKELMEIYSHEWMETELGKDIEYSRIFGTFIIRKSKFPQNPKRSVRFSGKRTKRSVQKRKARNTQKAETKVL
jgi:hypothetical protein